MAWGTIELPDLDGIEEAYAPKPITPTMRRKRFKPETERHRTNAERLFDNDDDVDTYLEQYEADNAPDMTPSPTLRGRLQQSRGQADTTRPAFNDPVEATREAERASSNNPLTLFDRAGDAVLKPLQRHAGDVAEAVGGQIPDFKVRRPGLFGQDLPLEYEEDDGTRTELGKSKVSVKPGKVARFGAEAIVPGSTEDLAFMAGAGGLGKVGGAAIKARAAGKAASTVEEGVSTAAGANRLVPRMGFGIEDVGGKSGFTRQELVDSAKKQLTYLKDNPAEDTLSEYGSRYAKVMKNTDDLAEELADVAYFFPGDNRAVQRWMTEKGQEAFGVVDEDLSPLERLLKQSQEKIQTEGRPAAQQAFKANADETAEAMARETAAKGDQYAEATRLSKRVSELTGDAPEAVRKTAIGKTKQLLDDVVKAGKEGFINMPKVGLGIENVDDAGKPIKRGTPLTKKTPAGKDAELTAEERYLRGGGVEPDLPDYTLNPIDEKPPTGNAVIRNLLGIANASKRTQTSGDVVGASFRQAAPAWAVNPKSAAKNLMRGVKAYMEDPEATAVMDEIAKMPRWFDDDPRRVVTLTDDAGEYHAFAVPSVSDVFGLNKDYATPGFEKIAPSALDTIVSKINILEGRSEKSMRAILLGNGGDRYNAMVDSAIKAGITDPDWYKHYGDIARVFVGYGDVPQILKGFSNAFYSLRNTAARFQILSQPITKPGPMFDISKGSIFSASPRGQATMQLTRFALAETANMRLLAAAGEASGLFEAGYDPLKPNFGRITFEDENGKDFSTDLLGGFGSMIKAQARTAYTVKEVVEGVPQDEWTYNPFAEWYNFSRNKMAAIPGAGVDTVVLNSGLVNKDEVESPFSMNLLDPKTWEEAKPLGAIMPFFMHDTVQGLIKGDIQANPESLFTAGGVMLAQFAGLPTNTYAPSTRDVRDIVAQEMGLKDFESADPEQQKTIDMDERVVSKKADSPTAYSEAVKEEIGPLLEKRDQAEAAAKEGNLSAKITDTWRELRTKERAKRETLVNTYLKGIDNNKDATRKAIDGFYSNEVENADGTVDWDKTDAKQQQWLRTQTPEIGEYIASYLRAQRLDESEMYQEYLGFNDKREQAGLFDDTKTPADKEAIYAKNPELDVQQWYFGGGVVKDGKPVAGPALQSDAAVKAALARQLPNRPIKRDGLPRPVNETPQTLKAWNYSKNPVQFYLDAGGTKNLDTYSREEFGVPYARLKPEDKTKIKGQVRSDLLEDDENLKAWLIFWGAHKIGKNTDDETIEQVNRLYRQYGAPPKEPLVKR